MILMNADDDDDSDDDHGDDADDDDDDHDDDHDFGDQHMCLLELRHSKAVFDQGGCSSQTHPTTMLLEHCHQVKRNTTQASATMSTLISTVN